MARILGTIASLLVATAVVGYAAGATGIGDDLASGLERFIVAAGAGTQERDVPRDAIPAAPRAMVAELKADGAHLALAAHGAEAGVAIAMPPTAARGLRLAQAPDGSRATPPRPGTPVGSNRIDRNATGTGAPASAQSLTRAIQGELKRVGCYAGDVDGDWGAATRRAMQAFNDRVNATLPTSEPDYILLTLLQGHAAKACGADCPPGRAKDDNGTCLPRSVLAERRRRTPVTEAQTATGTGQITTGAAPSVVGQSPSTAPGPAPRLAATARVDGPTGGAATPSRAEIERQRIAAAEARRQQLAAQAEARAEADRLARLAAAEKARQAAEIRRQQELAALRERTDRLARKAAAAKAEEAEKGTPTPSAASGLASPAVQASPKAAEPPPHKPEAIAAPRAKPDVIAAAPVDRVVEAPAKRPIKKPREARYVGRFVPPPPYRVGRLTPARLMPVARISVSARPRHTPQQIFRDLQHRMP